MHVLVQSYWLSKAGNSREEYEDSFCYSHRGRARVPRVTSPLFAQDALNLKSPRFAVADGATECIFSGPWARLLVHAFVTHKPRTPAALAKRVAECGAQWRQAVGAKSLHWSQQNKVLEGSFSALVGLSFGPAGSANIGRSSKTDQVSGSSHPAAGNGPEGCWTAFAIGDACLFQVRDNKRIAALPLEESSAFGYHPILLSTVAAMNRGLWEQANTLRKTGSWLAGDQFFLMTDALARWFLQEDEGGRQPWRRLNEFPATQESELPLSQPSLSRSTASAPATLGHADPELTGTVFANWVAQQRAARTLANDDVTLLIITIGN